MKWLEDHMRDGLETVVIAVAVAFIVAVAGGGWWALLVLAVALGYEFTP